MPGKCRCGCVSKSIGDLPPSLRCPLLSLQSARGPPATHDDTQMSTLPLDEFSIIEEQPDPLPKSPHGGSPPAPAPDHGPANEG